MHCCNVHFRLHDLLDAGLQVTVLIELNDPPVEVGQDFLHLKPLPHIQLLVVHMVVSISVLYVVHFI